MNLLLIPHYLENGEGQVFHYEAGRCAQCLRPIVRPTTPDIPPGDLRFIRAHIAWWHLGKHADHAANTLVLR